jgi:hypothetical protein
MLYLQNDHQCVKAPISDMIDKREYNLIASAETEIKAVYLAVRSCVIPKI